MYKNEFENALPHFNVFQIIIYSVCNNPLQVTSPIPTFQLLSIITRLNGALNSMVSHKQTIKMAASLKPLIKAQCRTNPREISQRWDRPWNVKWRLRYDGLLTPCNVCWGTPLKKCKQTLGRVRWGLRVGVDTYGKTLMLMKPNMCIKLQDYFGAGIKVSQN